MVVKLYSFYGDRLSSWHHAGSWYLLSPPVLKPDFVRTASLSDVHCPPSAVLSALWGGTFRLTKNNWMEDIAINSAEWLTTSTCANLEGKQKYWEKTTSGGNIEQIKFLLHISYIALHFCICLHNYASENSFHNQCTPVWYCGAQGETYQHKEFLVDRTCLI